VPVVSASARMPSILDATLGRTLHYQASLEEAIHARQRLVSGGTDDAETCRDWMRSTLFESPLVQLLDDLAGKVVAECSAALTLMGSSISDPTLTASCKAFVDWYRKLAAGDNSAADTILTHACGALGNKRRLGEYDGWGCAFSAVSGVAGLAGAGLGCGSCRGRFGMRYSGRLRFWCFGCWGRSGRCCSYLQRLVRW